MKNNTFYKVGMDDDKWFIYFFKPHWRHYYFGKHGDGDNVDRISPRYISTVLDRAVEMNENNPVLSNIKQYIILELFKND